MNVGARVVAADTLESLDWRKGTVVALVNPFDGWWKVRWDDTGETSTEWQADIEQLTLEARINPTPEFLAKITQPTPYDWASETGEQT